MRGLVDSFSPTFWDLWRKSPFYDLRPKFMPSLWSFKSTVASVFPRSSQSWVSHLIPCKFLNLSKFNLLTRGELWHFSWHCFYFSRVKSTFSWGRCAVFTGVLPVLWLRCMRVFVGLFSCCFSGASISPGKSGSYLSLGQYPPFKMTPFCTSCAQWHRYVIFTSVARYDFRHCGLILEQTPFEVLWSVRCPVGCHAVVLSAWSCLRHVWVTWPSFGRGATTLIPQVLEGFPNLLENFVKKLDIGRF